MKALDQLINKENEARVYHTIKGKDICDDPVYINPKDGFKITRYIENVRVCDSMNQDDLNIYEKTQRVS